VEDKMEIKEYINMELEGLKRGMDRTLNGLTQQEIMWRPACGCNSIGLIIFHIARGEDSFVQGRLLGKPELWESEKWFNKLNMAESEAGSHYSIDQVNAFPIPELKDLLEYFNAVRGQTIEYVKNVKPDELEKKVKLPFGEFSIAGILSIIVSHNAQHTGEMSYLRGLERGMDK
jgi:hypothetical protein